VFDGKQWGGIAVLGAIAAGWSHVKQFLNNMRNLIIVTHQLTYWGHKEILARWLDNNIRFINFGAKSYVVKMLDGTSRVRSPIAAWNKALGTHLAFYGRIPLIITVSANLTEVSVTYLKGTFPIHKICEDLVATQERQLDAEMREDEDWSIDMFWLEHVWGSLASPLLGLGRGGSENRSRGESVQASGLEFSADDDSSDMGDNLTRLTLKTSLFTPIAGDIEGVINYSSSNDDDKDDKDKWLKRMYLTPKQRKVVDEIRFWMKSKEWYTQRGITWRRSMFLHGLPGTGKSSLAYAIATALDIPIRIFHLDTMTDKDFVSSWRAYTSTAVIHLLEDFDTVFDGRENRFRNDMNNALSFECFLNVLDGVEVSDGIITIVTTNHPDGIDDALLRPGRLDTEVEFGPLDMDGKLHIGNVILPHMSATELTEFFNKELPADETGAVIQEACIKEALRQYWADYKEQ
jgi:hypothetical protein